MTDTGLLTSPVGEIWYMAVNEAVENKKTGKSKREICLLLDSAEAKDFITSVKKVNKGIPVTEHTYSGEDDNLKAALKGKTKISAGTLFEVPVYDKDGNKLDEAPNFFKKNGDTGTAQMVVQPYTKSEKGGSINLAAVIIHNIESVEGAEGTDRETRLAQLREAVEAATKG